MDYNFGHHGLATQCLRQSDTEGSVPPKVIPLGQYFQDVEAEIRVSSVIQNLGAKLDIYVMLVR